MTELANRPNTAVLVIDVQNDVVAAAHARDSVIAQINQVVAQARSTNTPVIWVQHNDDDLPEDTDGWKIVPELDPQPDEPIVHKSFRDSFDGTNLETELASRSVGRLIVTGAQTDYCVRWTLHGALIRGYDTVLVSDAHTTDADAPTGMPSGAEIVAHTNSTWGSQDASTCSAAVALAADINLASAT